ncbi:Cas10/Cmr2 second palm domain-containing protein [Cyanobacterium aponinum]|uniref:Cas10/Cmr2 second palm domain-containing protein n=1 Tax=Cyanobacterium aponinum TaxID=379064 RepID=UPI000C12D2DC|nr:hypothetical protein [Cyanobacterium aponinum]PHV62001.1 hypothetical protein CSQ80_12720 [Cyanobacterium aponinum IPPAS B-1201]
MFLVLIETSGNQNFIFATNKLKENIGASELTYRVGTQWLLEIIGDIVKNPNLKLWQDSDLLRQNLLNSNHNPPIEDDKQSIEIIIAVSGKALLITKDEETAQGIITKITKKCLEKAPGINVTGVYVEFDWNKPIQDAVKQVYRKIEIAQSNLFSSEFRFLKLPILSHCDTSGLPASQIEINPENDKIPISQVSFTKRNSANDSLKRMDKLVQKSNFKFPENTNDLEKNFEEKLNWLGIVHADGNGLGQIFFKFEQFIDNDLKSFSEKNRDYINKLRKFSLALDLCTQNAFKEAIKVFKEDGKISINENKTNEILPIIPLVLGGDDLTVVCDGKKALEFTEKFLLAFEEETARNDLEDVGNIINEVSQKALKSDGLSACAGVAIVKPHFPFSVGYDLAESLLKSAKTVKNNVQNNDNKTVSCSALDFHIVYDSSGVDLELIRGRLELKENENIHTKLYKRPFVVTPSNKLKEATEFSQKWAQFYDWNEFKNKVKLLTKNKRNSQNENDEKKYLPPNQSNKLRSALFRGKESGDAQFQLIYKRYENITIELAESDKSLFQITPINSKENNKKTVYTTSFLDALDATDFL